MISREGENTAVVIPVLNAEKHLPACLDSLPENVEVILSDGGSRDHTCEIAKARGCMVIQAQGGRGGQISEALHHCSRELILVLHSDCVLESGAIGRMERYMEQNPLCAGGALGVRFQQKGFLLRFVEWVNFWRSLVFHIYFGDQGQFFRRKFSEDFPAIPLMEDVEFSLRLKKNGRSKFLRHGICTANYKYQGKYLKRFRLVLHLLGKFFLMRGAGRLTPSIKEKLANKEAFYGKYYKR
jgi:glycosyltransferase involved in cell wall biosynthesis